MRIVAVALLVLAGAGCGKEKQDNSKVQSPDDQPIGVPKGIGAQSGGPADLKGSGGKSGGQLQKIEVKQ